RSLTVDERKLYLKATKCMYDTPSKFKSRFPIARSRYDDFVILHIDIASFGGHEDGDILAWHRYVLQQWEDALINECGWKGGIPYWNWFLDTPSQGGSFLKSPIFDPISGFGGNGKPDPDNILQKLNGTGGGCIQDGIFKDVKLWIGPVGQMIPNNPRCLTRNFLPWVVEQHNATDTLRKALKARDFREFMKWVQKDEAGGPHNHPEGPPALNVIFDDLHGIGHYSINGEMGDPLGSMNEPLFWLHHGGIDQFWSLWQDQDLTHRL
ncbi:Di-copper centre-containing protein, partial [Microthyrium microscopicum]